MTDARLRELYARALAQAGMATAGARSPECVTPEELLALVRREGPEARRLATLDHAMACDACRREYELLRAIEEAGTEIGGNRMERRPRWRMAPLGLAAGILIAVGIGLGLQNVVNRPDVPRGGTDAVVLIAPPPSIADESAITFAWHAVPNAHGYILEILGDNQAQVFSKKTSDTTIVLGPRQLRPGEYRWWIRAMTPAGQLASPIRRLRVRTE